METVVAIIAFAVCALAFEANVTKIPDGPVTDAEFAASVEFEKQSAELYEVNDERE